MSHLSVHEDVQKFLDEAVPGKDGSKRQKRCTHCAANMIVYFPKYNGGLVSALRKMLVVVRNKQQNDVHVSDSGEVRLSYAERANMTKLRHLGAVAHVKEEGKIVQAHWLITRRGFAFLRGEPVPAWAKTYRNEVIGSSEETITIHEVIENTKNGEKYWDDIDSLRRDIATAEDVERAIEKMGGI